jgi:hypothetical protein
VLFLLGIIFLYATAPKVSIVDFMELTVGVFVITGLMFCFFFYINSPDQNAHAYGEFTKEYKVGYDDFNKGYNTTYVELGENGNDFRASCYKLGYKAAQRDTLINKERVIIRNRMASV